MLATLLFAGSFFFGGYSFCVGCLRLVYVTLALFVGCLLYLWVMLFWRDFGRLGHQKTIADGERLGSTLEIGNKDNESI